jgi:outer membrane lipopolysaccharide assembly protein LptE/RlpB
VNLLKVLVVGSLIFLFALGCGYGLVDNRPNPGPLDLKGKNVAIHIIRNNTDEPDIEYIITKELISEFIRDPRIKIVRDDKRADYIIDGEVKDYYRTVLSLDYQGRAQYYRLTVRVDLVIEDAAGNDILELKDLSEDSEFHTSIGVESDKELEREALRKASKELAQRLVGMFL